MARPGSRGLAAALLLAAPAAGLLGCGGASDAGGRTVVVLGFDGMDYGLTRELMDSGRMPHFTRLAGEGAFSPLATSVPPQSPVAWSDFITGMDAGGHGIFDFLHRDPQTMIPYLSTSRTEGPDRVLKVGRWRLPLSGGRVELLRHGTPFWEPLAERGIGSWIFRMPANFPPSGSAARELSGMGTPDLLGTPGTFSFYTSELFAADREVTGGKIYEAWPEEGTVWATLYGPENPFLAEPRKVSAEFAVHLDPVEAAAKLVVGGEERILMVGEWSDWVAVEFQLAPTQKLRGMCRFYLRALAPEFELYVSPLNIDPLHPAMPISSPQGYAAELARIGGRFYTQGMPEDTKALTEGVLDREEFLEQARIAGGEVTDQYRLVLDRFEGGLLFYYFGNLDMVSHMMWRPMDPGHPAYDPEEDGRFAGVVPSLYEEIDRIVGYTLERMPPGATLVVMSDHGFTSWRRAFHLNTWLWKEGYLGLRDPDLEDDPGLFANVDWSRTRAYGLGINGLYVNLQGRERQGTVPPGAREALMEEIAGKLLGVVDPATGAPAITKVYRREEIYGDRGHLEIGPDLVVGYAVGTRCSNESALGEVTKEVFTDNTEEWSGDHLMDHEAVPGILLTNRPLRRPVPALKDLAGAILAEFGIEGFPRHP